MEDLVLYYSYTGNTKRLAEEFAREKDLPLCEIRTQKSLNKLAAYTAGCFKALKGAGMDIEAPAVDLSGCEEAHVFAPIWAGHIAPPMLSALALLPKGAEIELHLVSGSGESNQELINKRLERLGLEVEAYEDIRQ